MIERNIEQSVTRRWQLRESGNLNTAGQCGAAYIFHCRKFSPPLVNGQNDSSRHIIYLSNLRNCFSPTRAHLLPQKNYPFSNLIALERHLFSIKMKETIQKLEIKYRVGVGSALLTPKGGILILLIIWIKMIIYTQYVIIAYCFIMYYSTEVQIIATIWNK